MQMVCERERSKERRLTGLVPNLLLYKPVVRKTSTKCRCQNVYHKHSFMHAPPADQRVLHCWTLGIFAQHGVGEAVVPLSWPGNDGLLDGWKRYVSNLAVEVAP